MATYRPPAKPGWALKWGFKLPITLYRLRLGWLLGHRFLMLTHWGRKSGKLRHTVLEVVHYDPATRESAVVSAYGERADWYQNILAHPAVEVQTGGRWYIPQQRLLSVDERFAALKVYQRRYRRAFQAVMRFLGYPYDGTEAGLHGLADGVAMVAFRPREEL
ncbi:MAG TPA: nitroreductase family deazaflavin-dependent oxidoreductase [Ktedonobacterales bacterium]|nr:nitroreductase family deazaflavin-dependent oxidoreductase [Ktedonobacterales bacterium]